MDMNIARAQFAAPSQRPCPRDFEQRMIAIGRLSCQEHYGVGRSTINRWLDECGSDRLIKARADHVRIFEERAPVIERFLDAVGKGMSGKRASIAAGVSWRTIFNWRKADPAFAAAWASRTKPRRPRSIEAAPSPTMARHAAQYLRIVRNGGWIVSPAGADEWWVGRKRMPTAALIEQATKCGFDANLTLQAADRIV